MIDKEQKLPVTECVPVIQGEGQSIGHPMILIRMSKCNLNCVFKGSICDSAETSWHHDAAKNSQWSLREIEDVIKANPHIKKIMLTGGQPTYQPKYFKIIVNTVKELGMQVEVEDNGTTYIPLDRGFVDLMTFSPKLRNSIPPVGKYIPELGRIITQKDHDKHEKGRRNIRSLKKWIRDQNYQFKFVISDEDQIKEALDLVEEVGGDRDKVYFMPEGMSREQLDSRRQWLYERCIELGIKYSDRLHVIVYDTKKGV